MTTLKTLIQTLEGERRKLTARMIETRRTARLNIQKMRNDIKHLDRAITHLKPHPLTGKPKSKAHVLHIKQAKAKKRKAETKPATTS